MSDLSNLVSTAPRAKFRTECNAPTMYRLARTPAGDVVLQGLFTWIDQDWKNGQEWRTLKTVELPT